MIKFFLYTLLSALILARGANASDQISKSAILEVQENDIVFGSPDAKHTVIEYSSFSCVHCSSFHEKYFADLYKKYISTNIVRWVIRLYVTDENSLMGSSLIHCLPKDKQYSHLDLLYKQSNLWVYSQFGAKDILKNIIFLGGALSEENFNKCIENESTKKMLIHSRFLADKKLEIIGTPAFFFDKKEVSISDIVKMDSNLLLE